MADETSMRITQDLVGFLLYVSFTTTGTVSYVGHSFET
jgi:hypothetical protein